MRTCTEQSVQSRTVFLEIGILEKTGENPVIKMDTPAGIVTAVVHREGKRIKEVSFYNFPSFVYLKDQTVEVPGLENVH